MQSTCYNSSNFFGNTGGMWGTAGGNCKWETCDQCGGWPYKGNAICGKCMGQGGQLIWEPYQIVTTGDSTTITIGNGTSVPSGTQKILPGGGLITPQEDGIDRAVRRLEELKKKVK